MFRPIYFEETDFAEHELPAPGYYESTIASAELKKSSSGNVMLLVVHELLGVPAPYDRVADYFVLDGSERAVRVAKSRLVRLFRASGLHPKSGDEIASEDLFGARLGVKVEHDAYRGRPRLRVTNYHPLDSSRSGERVPF